MLSIVTLKTRRNNSAALIGGLRGRLIVSCQAPQGDPFRSPQAMASFAQAAVAGGAAGIRANSPEDVRAIREAVDVPIIALQKHMQTDRKILITPSFEDAVQLVAAGADIVAVDCTARGRMHGALDRIRRIRTDLDIPVMADIATVDEAVAAAAAGAHMVASTMRGYTDETAIVRLFEPEFIAALVARVNVPVFAEGRIQSPSEALRAIAAGAHAVIVGTAITRPEAIATRFARALESAPRLSGHILGIDIGGTNTKSAIVTADGRMCLESTAFTPRGGGRDSLLEHLRNVVKQALDIARDGGLNVDAIGVATAGWVDHESGSVQWATANLPGWTGTRIAEELHAATGLRVAVENDANALAVAERHFGAGRGVANFVCLTLGTGVGGGCYIGGSLLRGAHCLANALGHLSIKYDGLPCACGQRGCLEMYTSAAALVSYAGGSFTNAEEVISAAHAGDATAIDALRNYGCYLAAGLASIIHLLDPELVLISGGLAQRNDLLFKYLNDELARVLIAADQRRLEVRPSALGYYAGVLGAAAVVLERYASHETL